MGPDRRRIPRSGCQALVRRPLLQLPRHKCRRRPWPPQMSWYDEKSDRHRPTSPRPPSGGPNAPPINATSPTSPGESAALCCVSVTHLSPTPGTAVSPHWTFMPCANLVNIIVRNICHKTTSCVSVTTPLASLPPCNMSKSLVVSLQGHATAFLVASVRGVLVGSSELC